MKIDLLMGDFQSVIKTTKRVIGKVSSLSILNHLLIKADNNSVTAIASNLDDVLEVSFRAGVIEPGAILIDKETLSIIEKMKGNSQGVITNDKIKFGNRTIQYEIDSDYPPEEFPLPQECNNLVFSTTQKELLRLLGVGYVCDKKRGIDLVTSVCIDDGYFVATDSYRMAMRQFNFQNKLTDKVSMSIYSAELLQSLLSKKSDEIVECYTDDDQKHLCFVMGNIRHTTRLMDYKFIDWEQFRHIPEVDTEMVVDTKGLLEELALLKTVMDKYISIMVKDNTLQIKTKNNQKLITVDIPVIEKHGKDMERKIYLNGAFFIDMVKQQGKQTVVKFVTHKKMVYVGEDFMLEAKIKNEW